MISLLIPCFNERDVLRLTYDTIVAAAPRWGEDIEIVFVDDGSADNTWDIIQELSRRDPRVRGIKLARNFGHQAALGAGWEHVTGEAVIVLDADLQDPPSLIEEMLAQWKQGYEVVYAQRNARQGESWFKKVTGHVFYRLLDRFNDVSIPRDTGDFALLDASVVRMLREFPEQSLFWRGLRCWTGAKQTAVKFDRPPRAAGETKYTIRKLAQLASNGLLSFSSAPLRLPLYLAAATLVVALALSVLTGLHQVLTGAASSLISPTLLAVLYLGTLQLFCLGVIGEYLNRIYDEVRARPRWLVKHTVGFAGNRSATESRPKQAA